MEYLDGGELFDRVANEGRKKYLYFGELKVFKKNY
jgi:hypothetical protein